MVSRIFALARYLAFFALASRAAVSRRALSFGA
jgi:hypothetical protein